MSQSTNGRHFSHREDNEIITKSKIMKRKKEKIK